MNWKSGLMLAPIFLLVSSTAYALDGLRFELSVGGPINPNRPISIALVAHNDTGNSFGLALSGVPLNIGDVLGKLNVRTFPPKVGSLGFVNLVMIHPVIIPHSSTVIAGGTLLSGMRAGSYLVQAGVLAEARLTALNDGDDSDDPGPPWIGLPLFTSVVMNVLDDLRACSSPSP